MRDKIKTLFNKNHITVKKTTTSTYYSWPCLKTISRYDYSNALTQRMNRHWVPKTTKTVEKESPLGFVYTQTIVTEGHYEYNKNYVANPCNITFKHYAIYINNDVYEIIYPRAYNGVNIGVDTRPWEIADSRCMEDHFVDDLLKVINDICCLCEDNKISKCITDHMKYNSNTEYESTSYSEWKKQLFIDLFGNANGPRYQTDIEKIISHGFDTKISFRKRKE